MRVIVTGSRTWPDPKQVRDVLDKLYLQSLQEGEEFTLVHGGAKDGADLFAHEWADQVRRFGAFGITEVVYEVTPEMWRKSKGAGLARNTVMINDGGDVVQVFGTWCALKRCKYGPERHLTHGTKDALTKAREVGLQVEVHGP